MPSNFKAHLLFNVFNEVDFKSLLHIVNHELKVINDVYFSNGPFYVFFVYLFFNLFNKIFAKLHKGKHVDLSVHRTRMRKLSEFQLVGMVSKFPLPHLTLVNIQTNEGRNNLSLCKVCNQKQ